MSATFSGERRGKAVGTWAAAGAIAGAVAPLIGGWLVDGVGWPAIFLINVPIALAAIALAWRFVPEHRAGERPPPDWLGALVATLSLGLLTWALTIWSASGRAGTTALVASAAASFSACAVRRGGATPRAATRWCRSTCSARAPSSA